MNVRTSQHIMLRVVVPIWSVYYGKNWISDFSLPEFNLKKQMSWKFHVDDQSKASNTYDMIMEQDFPGKLGIIINFNVKTVSHLGY
jgi:lysylphosphatidylglycerol synthetase-like protein (DUF2156 family)